MIDKRERNTIPLTDFAKTFLMNFNPSLGFKRTFEIVTRCASESPRQLSKQLNVMNIYARLSLVAVPTRARCCAPWPETWEPPVRHFSTRCSSQNRYGYRSLSRTCILMGYPSVGNVYGFRLLFDDVPAPVGHLSDFCPVFQLISGYRRSWTTRWRWRRCAGLRDIAVSSLILSVYVQ